MLALTKLNFAWRKPKRLTLAAAVGLGLMGCDSGSKPFASTPLTVRAPLRSLARRSAALRESLLVQKTMERTLREVSGFGFDATVVRLQRVDNFWVGGDNASYIQNSLVALEDFADVTQGLIAVYAQGLSLDELLSLRGKLRSAHTLTAQFKAASVGLQLRNTMVLRAEDRVRMLGRGNGRRRVTGGASSSQGLGDS